MVKVKLIYNPYLLKTELSVQGTAITKDSSLAFIFDKLLNKWLGVSGAWRGFFLELADAVGTDNLEIYFVGTAEDFEALKAAADFAKKNYHLSIDLKYLLDGNAQTNASARQKLNALVSFLNAPNDFLADIRPALEKTLSDEGTVEVISLTKNFPARDILSGIANNPKLKIAVNHSTQNLTLTLLKALAEVNQRLILFVFDGEKISAPTVEENLRDVTQAIGRGEYAQTVCENIFFVCTDTEKIPADRVRTILISCGFEEPKIFLVNSTFAELLQKKSFDQEKFTASRELLSASDCKNFQRAPISFAIKTRYENKIASCREIIDECTAFLKFYSLHKPEEIQDAERRRNEALNEIALINSNVPALEQTILTYFERHALPVTVRKIYLGVQKKIAATKRDISHRISDTSDSLQRLRRRITAFNSQASQKNPCRKFLDAADVLNFNSAKFEKFYRELSVPPIEIYTLVENTSEVPTVEKNLVGHTETYVKISDVKKYSPIWNATFEKKLTEFIDAIAAYFATSLLTPARKAVAQLDSAEQTEFQGLIAGLEKILGDKNFDVPTFKFFTVLSYENIGGKFASVEYVSADQISSEYAKAAAQFLEQRRLKLKRAASKFVTDFQAQAEEKSSRLTPLQDNSCELQKLRQAVSSKEKSLASCKRNLEALENFRKNFERLLEIKS